MSLDKYYQTAQGMYLFDLVISRFIEGDNADKRLVECPICKNILVNSVITRCGHTFCKKCYYEHHSKKSKCCECLSDLIDDPVPC